VNIAVYREILVIPPASMPCTTFCIFWFYQPAFCWVCVFILWTSCLLVNK